MNYKIKSGDTLSQIVKDKYGVTGNDIKKYYTEIAKINNIENPNLIYSGDTINLPDNIFQTEKTTSTADDFNNWLDTNNNKLDKIAEENSGNATRYSDEDILNMSAEELANAQQTISNSIKSINEQLEEVNSSEFTMFETKGMMKDGGTIDSKMYVEAGAKFAQSIYDNWEKDSEDGIDYEEYFEAEKARMGDMEITSEVEKLTQKAFEMMDIDNDGLIDASEIQAIFSTIDMADNNPDGKFNFETYGNALTAADTIKENAQIFHQKYLEK